MMLVPARIRARFFSRRARIANLGVLAGLIAGGLTLEHLTDDASGPVFWFAAVFAAGAICRAGSALSLSLQTETGPPDNHRVVRGLELMRRFRHGPDGRFILFMIFMTLGVQVAQPFFIPFMRVELGFSYDHVLALVGASFVAKGLAQPLWGLFAHRYGAVHLLWMGGLGIVPLSALWLASDSFWYLLASQLIAGAAWGAYELASFLLLVETTREQERTSLWATYNLLNSTAMVGGSVIGAKVLGGLGADADAYAVVFWVSLAARLSTVLYLIRTHEVLRRPTPVVIGVDAVRPSAGSIDKPILASVAASAASEPG
jgi:MFS family permease